MIKHNKGYTLLELVIVLAVAAVLLKVTLPAADSEKRHLKCAINELAADIRYAQRMAVNENKSCTVNFYTTNDSYNITLSSDTLTQRKYFQNDIYVYENTSVSKSVKYTSLGTTGSACKITLASPKYKISLTVTVGSGRVKIFEMEKKS